MKLKVKLPNSPLAKSLMLHVIIVACLVFSISFTADPLPMPVNSAPLIQATFIDAQAIADQKRAEAQAQAAEREKQRQAAEQQRQQEVQAAARAKQAREKREQEQAEQRRVQELKRKAAEELQLKKQREEAAKQAQIKKQKEAQEQAELEKIMQEQMAQERAAQQQRRKRQVLTEVEKYQALIYQTIKQFLIEDPDFKGKQCLLSIRLASTGLVTEVVIKEGDNALCLAARSAVLRPDKLPVSSEPDVFEQMRNINLTVKL